MSSRFNLIIMAGIDYSAVSKSQSGVEKLDKDRLLKYTRDEFKAHYEGNIAALSELPTLILGEAHPTGIPRTPAFLSRVRDVHESGRYISFGFKHTYSNLTSEEVYASRLFDISIDGRGITENLHTHWAVKAGNLYETFFELLKPRDLSSKPKFFGGGDWPLPTLGHVAVMMPFHANFDPVYEEIKASCNGLRLEAKRVDEIYKLGKVMDDIFSIIVQSKVVVCDLTDRNPNVLYEVGLAHAFSREVILLVQSEDDVPFDLRQFRYVKYSQGPEGLKTLRANLTRSIKEIAD